MLIYGKNVAKEKINSGEKINKIFLSDKFHDNELFALIKKNNLKYTILNSKVMDNKVNGLHQGIIIEVDDVKTYDFDFVKNIKKNNPVLVMLDHLEDPHNFGAIIRTCEALGIDAIIIPNDRSVTINSTVVKTSAGAIYNMPIVRVSNLNATIDKLKDIGYWIVGTDMTGEDYKKIDYNMPVCLIIGNEGKGMAKTIKEKCDFMASIPMIGKINSLNASVSCAIVLAKIMERDIN